MSLCVRIAAGDTTVETLKSDAAANIKKAPDIHPELHIITTNRPAQARINHLAHRTTASRKNGIGIMPAIGFS